MFLMLSSVHLPRGRMGWSALIDCVIPWLYSLTLSLPAAKHTTESYLRATPMRSGCLVATIDRTLPNLVVWYSLWLLYGYY